jgi:V/A-type H+-transporting ATPase subunit E
MGARELIESLRRASEESIRLHQKDAEQEADSVQASLAKRIAELRKHYADELTVAEMEESRKARAEAGSRVRAIKLAAEKTLSDRLFAIARESLTQLRHDAYPASFEKLARELPSLPWKLVRVHPADIDLARKHLSDAEIVPTETITGGMDAAVADGTIRVINTLEKRLELAWADLLPLLISEVYQEVSDGASQKKP